MDDLILENVEELHERRAYPVRMDGDGPAALCRQSEHVVATTVDPDDPVERSAARVRAGRDFDSVGQLVSDQRLRVVHEVRQQDLAPERPGRNGPVVVVDDLDDRLFADVHADVVERAGGDDSHFGREVALDRLHPGGLDPRGRVLGQHLGAREDDPRGDGEATLELLLRQQRDDARVAADHLGLVVVERGDHLVERGRHGDPRRARASGQHRRDHLSREVERSGSADARDPRLGGHAESRERADEDGDPMGELGLRVGKQARHSGRPRCRENAVLAEIERAGVGGVQERLQLRETETPVRHDAIELLHQDRLRQRRQVGQFSVLGAWPQRLAVVGRACDRVADQ